MPRSARPLHVALLDFTHKTQYSILILECTERFTSRSTTLTVDRLFYFSHTLPFPGIFDPSLCPAGRWGATQGAKAFDECQVCKGGTFSNTSGATTARCSGLCPPGKYSDDAADKCSFCPNGRWGATEGAKTLDGCMLCRGGTYSNTPGATTAQCSGLCPPGKYSDDGYAQCTDCGQGRYQPESNRSLCVSCAIKTTTLGEGSTKCVCDKGFFGSPASGGGAGAAEVKEVCTKCPVGFVCDQVGVVVATAEVRSGFWRGKESEGKEKRKACCV